MCTPFDGRPSCVYVHQSATSWSGVVCDALPPFDGRPSCAYMHQTAASESGRLWCVAAGRWKAIVRVHTPSSYVVVRWAVMYVRHSMESHRAYTYIKQLRRGQEGCDACPPFDGRPSCVYIHLAASYVVGRWAVMYVRRSMEGHRAYTYIKQLRRGQKGCGSLPPFDGRPSCVHIHLTAMS